MLIHMLRNYVEKKKKQDRLGSETSEDLEKQAEFFKLYPVGDRESLNIVKQIRVFSQIIQTYVIHGNRFCFENGQL